MSRLYDHVLENDPLVGASYFQKRLERTARPSSSLGFLRRNTKKIWEERPLELLTLTPSLSDGEKKWLY